MKLTVLRMDFTYKLAYCNINRTVCHGSICYISEHSPEILGPCCRQGEAREMYPGTGGKDNKWFSFVWFIDFADNVWFLLGVKKIVLCFH